MKLNVLLATKFNEIFRLLKIYKNLDIKNYYILRAFLGCIIYAVLLFVTKAEPSETDTAAFDGRLMPRHRLNMNIVLNAFLNI